MFHRYAKVLAVEGSPFLNVRVKPHVALLLTALLSLTSCSKSPSEPHSKGTHPKLTSQTNPFAKQTYESVEQPIRVTFISDRELEVKIKNVNAVCDYSREGNIIRAVGTMDGTKRSFYFAETNGTLLNESGVVLFGPEEFTRKSEAKKALLKCSSNLKNICLAMRIFAVDNGDKFPFQVSQKEGGTKEFCSLDSLGYDVNAFRHFLIISNELSTPKLLVCPSDTNRVAAQEFLSLQPANISYRLRTGENLKEGNPLEMLAKCPIHRLAVMCDATVQTEP